MAYEIQTYPEFLEERKKYKDDQKCYIPGCNKPGLYEGGDARCWCPMCEKHARLKEHYVSDLKYIKRRLIARLTWAKDDEKAKHEYRLATVYLNEIEKAIKIEKGEFQLND